VKRIMAEYHHHGDTLEVQAPKARGKPDCRAAVNLQPVIREYVRTSIELANVWGWRNSAVSLSKPMGQISLP